MNPETDYDDIARFNLAIPRSLRDAIKDAAQARGESMERFATRALRAAILTPAPNAAPAHPTPAEMRAARDAKRAADSTPQPKRRR